MVTIAPPHTNDVEQKKRKQTLERTKANYLSKQLQMRLQYAKLKVEHGWQRQNLNEVENLYFHHSQVRGLRPVVPARPVTLISMNPMPHTAPVAEHSAMVVDDTSQHAISEAPHADNSQSHTSPQRASRSPVASKATPLQNPLTHATSTSSASTLPEKVPSHESSQSTPAPALLHTQSDTTPQQPLILQETTIPHRTLDFSDPGTMQKFAQMQMQLQPQPQPQSKLQSKAQSQNQIPITIQTQSQPQPQPYNPYMPVSRQSSQPQPNPFTPQPPPQYSFTQSYQASSAQNQSNPQPTLSQPSSSSQSPFGNGSGPLTYDSFWSTHSSAGSMYRSHAGFTASATPTGHLAMITPGGHAAVMTAEGVYVGAAGYTGRVSG